MHVWVGAIAKGRLIRSWTKTHTYTKPLSEPCDRCRQPITFGSYVREVWVYPSTRYISEFVIKRIHADPICPMDRGH